MIAEQHTCGRCEDLIGDYVEIGVQSFYPAQSINDLVKIKDSYGDKLVLCGGYNSQGACAVPGAPEEVMRAEARRMIDSYARGGGFIASTANQAMSDPETQVFIRDEFFKYSKDFYKKAENRIWVVAG